MKTNYSKEDFIIPDKGWASYEGPIHIKKLTGTLDLASKTGDAALFQIAQMLSPHDYSIFPLSRNMAVMCMSVFFKLCLPCSPYKIKFTEEAPTLSKALGFGSESVITPPVPKSIMGKGKEYHYSTQQLSKSDVIFFNSLLLDNADQFFAFAEKDRVQQSIEAYGKYAFVSKY